VLKFKEEVNMAAKLERLGGTQKKKGKLYPFIGVKMAVKLEPLGDRVVVKPSPKEEVTKSGIVIPDTAKEKPQEGQVMAVGPGRMTEDGKRIPMDVKVGDIVIYAKYGGAEIKEGDEELIILRESDILAKRRK
jgi:chaperonin GroES